MIRNIFFILFFFTAVASGNTRQPLQTYTYIKEKQISLERVDIYGTQIRQCRLTISGDKFGKFSFIQDNYSQKYTQFNSIVDPKPDNIYGAVGFSLNILYYGESKIKVIYPYYANTDWEGIIFQSRINEFEDFFINQEIGTFTIFIMDGTEMRTTFKFENLDKYKKDFDDCVVDLTFDIEVL